MRRVVRIVIKSLIGFLFIAGLFNYIWELFGPTGKLSFVLITGILSILYFSILILAANYYGKYFKIFLFISIFFLGSVSAATVTRTVNMWMGEKNPEFLFLHRIERMMERNKKMFVSTYMPKRWYGTLKNFFGRPWYPELLDFHHSYDSINIELFHINHLGIYEYSYYFNSYPIMKSELDASWYFMCQGEGGLSNHFKRISVHTSKDHPSLDLHVESVYDNLESFTAIGWVQLPEEIDYLRRSFCASNSMKKSKEGFIVDLRNLVHPPDTLKIRLITNQKISQIGIHRLKSNDKIDILNWINADPSYYTTSDIIEMDMITNSEVILDYRDSIVQGVSVYGGQNKSAQFSQSSVGNWEISAYISSIPLYGSENILVVRYNVDKHYCPACKYSNTN